jgi:hypothetical protein
MLESILESKEWLVGADGRIIESSQAALLGLTQSVSSLPKKETDLFLREQLLKFVNSLKMA